MNKEAKTMEILETLEIYTSQIMQAKNNYTKNLISTRDYALELAKAQKKATKLILLII